jgi:cobalt/nickel transport system ATP-binding protein
MSHHIVEVRDLHYAYPDGTQALRGVSFRIGHGDAVALVGANGAGKSTLILHLNGYLQSTGGEVVIGDTIVTRQTAVLARRAIGMVFQDPDDQLFMPTVAEDVAFGPLNAGLPTEQVAFRVAQALARVGMTHVSARPPYRLSAGEKRAVAIATVLAMAPDILVMDEPSANLDPRARRRLIGLLQSFDHTRIIATHDLELVVEVCSRVIVLDDGKVVADGPVEGVLGDEALMTAHGLERPHILGHPHPHASGAIRPTPA